MRSGAVLVLAIGILSALGAPEVHASRRAAVKEWLLFDSARTGRTEVYALPAAGHAGLRQLTFSGGSNPRPAPNGRFVLFDRSSGTWIMRPGGHGEKLLVRGGKQAAWAPDSRHIAYVPQKGGIAVESREGSGRRVLSRNPDDSAPRWSPDGRTVAFLEGERLVGFRAGRRSTIATGVADAYAWSPSGRRIAFRNGTTLAVVNANGTGHATLVDQWYPDDTPDGPVWSPNGQQIAYTDVEVQIVDVATRRVHGLDPCSLPSPSSTEPVWDRSGEEIAFVDKHDEICTSAVGGPPAILHVDDRRSRPFFLAWTTPPPGTHYRKAAPSNDTTIVASASELKAKAPIEDIAADGNRVAFISCFEVGTWTPGGRHSFVEVRRDRPLCTDNSTHTDERLWNVTLANDLVGYGDEVGEAAGEAWILLSDSAAPATAGILGPASEGVGSTGIGFLLGHGPMLVFSTMRGYACNGPDSPCPSPHGQPLWRVPLPLSHRECTPAAAQADPSPPCVKIAAGPVEPLAVDDTRVVVRTLGGTIGVLDGSGKMLVSLALDAAQGTAAAIAGPDLVVLDAGALRDYDASTGALLHEWPMPRVTTFGFCGTYFCGRGELELEDAAHGLAAYILGGSLHLLRLRDGADAVVGPATAARLEDGGLFYAYRGAAPYVGRIRFIPFDQLPLQ
jgi:WD40-like Beta Propeller Repeat